MNADFTPHPAAVFRRLWRRAYLWRICVLTAPALTALFMVCSPEFGSRLNDHSVPEQIAYTPRPPLPEVPSAASRAAAPVSVQEAKPVPPVAARPAAERSLSPHMAPPVNAAISLGVPGPLKTPDPSGLDPAMLGRTYSSSIDVNGFHLPLPPGKWAVLANVRVGKPQAPGLGLFLGHIEHRHLVGALRVFAVKSVELPGPGFPGVRGCVAGNPRYNAMQVDAMTPFGHQACWLMFNLYTPPLLQWADRGAHIATLDRIAAGDMAAKGVTYAQDLITIQFDRTEKWGAVQADYVFSPDREGIHSSEVLSFTDSDWYPSHIGSFPEKVAYIEKLKAWAQTFWPTFEAAFDQAEPSGGKPSADPSEPVASPATATRG